MLENGSIIFGPEDDVTPERLLRLFFKNIYVDKKLEQIIENITEQQNLEEEITKQIEEVVNINSEQIEEELPIVIEEEIIIPEENGDEFLEFDEEQAKNITENTVKLAKLMDLEQNKIEDLQHAAYYHQIGIIKFKKADLKQKDFQKKLVIESYNILKNEKNFPEKIAEVAKLYKAKYDPNVQVEDEKFPYYNIVAITSYYDKLLNRLGSKEKALEKMLQIGGNRFNIFILHKFINMMKDSNE